MFLNVCKQTFHICHVRISQQVKGILIWNLQHIIFIWRRKYWQIFKSALVYLQFQRHILLFLWRQNSKIDVFWNRLNNCNPMLTNHLKYLANQNNFLKVLFQVSLIIARVALIILWMFLVLLYNHLEEP